MLRQSKKILSNPFNIILSVLFSSLVTSLSAMSPTLAQEPAISQLLTPTKQTLELSPGETFTGYFDIHNRGTETFSIRVYATPYQVSTQNYNPNYNIENAYTMIKDWVTFEHDRYTIAPNTYQRIHYTITVPQDVPAGGQYSALMSEIISKEDSHATIESLNRVGLVLYAQVKGQTRSNGYGQIIENNLNTFFLSPPISASTLVKNNGNVHGEVTSILSIYPLFSNETIWSNEEDTEKNKSIILPETTRFIINSWHGSPRLGIFRVTQEIKFMGATDKVEKIVFICPLWLIFLILLIIISFIIRIVIHFKRRQAINMKGKGRYE